MTSWARASLSLAVAAAAVATSFAWQGHASFNLGDEGWLWYGAQRVMQGEVPLRDFYSYEPGRYYWSAALMRLWQDDGIVSLRVAVAIFQALGLAVGLALVMGDSGRARNPLAWLLVAVTLLAWMFPRHKLFDVTLSIVLVGVLAELLRRPTPRRYLLAGIAVGLVANFGRNHGLYGALGSVGVIAMLSIGRTAGTGPLRALGTWAAGFAIGVSPFVLMLLLVPGFAAAFVEGVRLIAATGSTSLPLPVPWYFVALPAFGTVVAAWMVLKRFRGRPVLPLLAAAALMSLPYSHFAYSRADLPHLAQSIFPLLLGAFALVFRLPAAAMWTSAAALCAASLFVMLPAQPGWRCGMQRECMSAEVGTSRLAVDRPVADDLALLHSLQQRFASGARPIYAAPFWPGAYPVLGRKAPVWEIYALFPRDEALQRLEVRRLEQSLPGFAIILDYALDGREELRFRNTHPIVDDYIRRNYERVDGASANPMYRIYRNPVVPDSSNLAP